MASLDMETRVQFVSEFIDGFIKIKNEFRLEKWEKKEHEAESALAGFAIVI